MFRYPCLCDKLDLNYMLGKGDQLSKFIEQLRYFGIGDLSQEFMIE